MVTIAILDVTQLSQEQQKSYRSLIDKQFWMCLRGKNPWNLTDTKIYAVAVITEDGYPCGIAIALHFHHTAQARLLSVSLEESYWKQDVLISLLKTLMSLLKKQRCSFISFHYSQEMNHASLLEQTYGLLGWKAPTLFMVRLYFKVAKFTAPWLKYAEKPLPEGIQLFPWKSLTLAEKNELQRQQKEDVFPSSVSPLNVPQLESLNSFGLRFKNSVIGWMITRRKDKNTIDYASFYIDRDYRNSWLPLLLLAKSIVHQARSGIPDALLEINLHQVDSRWITFTKKRLVPYAEKVERISEILYIF